ncbi:MAG: transpeptidase family protein [Bacteroidales bacterium]|nr:transpeptidase family protein [Bacteroidales bacterium]
MAGRRQNKQEDQHRISKILWFLYCIFLILSVVLIVRIVDIQYFWKPDPQTVEYFQPRRYESKTKPERGAIMDMNGKLLAISTPMYNINMDCAVLKDEFRARKSAKETDSLERAWREKARRLCSELPKVLEKDGKTAEEYYSLIMRNRESETMKGRRNVPITKNIDHSTYLKLCQLPLFNEGQFKSGMIKTEVDTRQYPYGTLAGRVIGDVRINRENPEESRFLGIEGQYDYVLHGKEGSQWMKRTDKGSIADPDSTAIEVEHGKDIRTTLDIDIQDIADRALRKNIGDDEELEGGCVVVLDVKTGAVRAMVNLQRNSKGELGEYFNMAVGRPGEPGSIFKAATLAALLEDGKVKLSDKLATNHGKINEMPEITADHYITDWERNKKTNTISIQDGFKISSNYVFRRLVLDHYGDNPAKFIDKLYEYKLNDAYAFDLEEKGGTKSRVPDPGSRGWSRSTLPSTAIGYSVMETPLNIAAFYNAIANNGKMMKPYLIESHESDGKVVKKFGPEMLNASAFSKATADSLTKALTMVTLEGTGATRLKNAKCVVAGKTGTARMVLDPSERKGSRDPYKDIDGRRKYQATFVGFFPADDPQYTAIVTVYTKPTVKSVYGGVIPAMTFRELVDQVWSLDSRWGEQLAERADVPDMKPEYIAAISGTVIPVPDVKGMGLKDALYAIENNGYKCQYEGVGHVASQMPEAGTQCKKGETVKLILR